MSECRKIGESTGNLLKRLMEGVATHADGDEGEGNEGIHYVHICCASR